MSAPDPQSVMSPVPKNTRSPIAAAATAAVGGAVAAALRAGNWAAQMAALRPAGGSALSEELQALVGELGAIIAPASTAVENGVDLEPLIVWTERTSGLLARAAAALGAMEAGAEGRQELERALAAGVQAANAHALAAANALRTHLATIMRDSSPLRETPAVGDTPAQAPAAPTLPVLAVVDRLQAAASTMSALAAGEALAEALRPVMRGTAGQLADTSLAIYQARAVVGARADWVTGYRQPTAAGSVATDANAASTHLRGRPGAAGVNNVFADSGFNRYGIEATRVGGQWEPQDWCGMFVTRHLFRSAGLDGELRGGFYHTDNVGDFFRYTQQANASRVPVTTWDAGAGRWRELRAYHEERGSVRTWTPRATVNTELAAGRTPFRSGDVALIDHQGGDTPGHIVMVDSYDADTGQLITIEGNTLGIRAASDGLVQRNAQGSPQQDQGNTSVALHIRQMTGTATANPGAGAYQTRAGATVTGVGRLSAVDFEDRRYSTLPIASFPAAMLTRSPDAMTPGSAGLMQSRERGPGQ